MKTGDTVLGKAIERLVKDCDHCPLNGKNGKLLTQLEIQRDVIN